MMLSTAERMVFSRGEGGECQIVQGNLGFGKHLSLWNYSCSQIRALPPPGTPLQYTEVIEIHVYRPIHTHTQDIHTHILTYLLYIHMFPEAISTALQPN